MANYISFGSEAKIGWGLLFLLFNNLNLHR